MTKNFTAMFEYELLGITTLRFTPPADVFNMSNPNNFCYCPNVRLVRSFNILHILIMSPNFIRQTKLIFLPFSFHAQLE